MEEREASVASSTDFYESDKKPDTPAGDSRDDALLLKRKADDLESPQHKRPKLDSPAPCLPDLKACAGLLPAIWQHIFLSCPLRTLGRLLQVNRSFHSYLTDVRNVSVAKPPLGFARLLKSESIWASARNMHPTKPPKPLPGFSELQMWQLVWSDKCQFCGRGSAFTPGEKIWQKGPGATGVRIVWPFAIRTCVSCLLDKCQTDANLLFSAASALRPALPFAFITNDQHYIPAYTLQAATTPAGVDIVKYYYKPHVAEITRELEQALSLGPAAAEEWSKGLEARGKERCKVAENWERWEVKYQWWREHQDSKRATSAPSPASTHQRLTRSPSRRAPSPIIHAPTPTAPAPQFVQARPPTHPPAAFTPQPTPGGGAGHSRGERNLHDANEAKANRKLDIERRCQLLSPPIPANILRHMDSFKAAIQISQPMNDYAWSMLHPRLIAQLPAAQDAEREHVTKIASLTTRAADRRQQDASLKEVKEVLDREWEESQRPVREKLSVIADEFINQDWDHGRAVTYENSPKFAVDLLMHVRRRYYAECPDATTVEAQNAGQPGEDLAKPKLVLENMKWVYDNKLKPLTEQFRKELFLCYGTGCETNTRFYGFEGVIQHFGAKHTNTFSVGNVVVAWREAEWPEDTPFHPDPISVKHGHHGSNVPGHGHSGYGSYYGGYTRAGTSTPHVQPHLPQASPGPYGYSGHVNGPFNPPQVSANSYTGYDYSHTYGATMDSYPSHQAMGPPGYESHAGNNGYMTSPAMPHSAIAPPPAAQPQATIVDQLNKQHDTVESAYRNSLFDKQVSTTIEMAQDIWKQTSGIKDFPNSLRIYVLLHRVISKFHLEFNHEPSLSHFIDAFSNHEIPKALKNAMGLSCKACQDGSPQWAPAYASRSEERRTYTVLNLLSHFQSHHGPSTGQHASLDWKEDMIELPGERFISGLIHAPGMDDEKLRMIATVFPRLFPTPLPRIGMVDNNGVASTLHSVSRDSKAHSGSGGTPGVSAEQSGPSSLASPYTGSPRPQRSTEDEYDPQHPALPQQPHPGPRTGIRKRPHQDSPPTDRRLYYAEPRYYVGSTHHSTKQDNLTDSRPTKLPRDSADDDYPRPREYLEFAPSPRRMRDAGPRPADYTGGRPSYRAHASFHASPQAEVVYGYPHEGHRSQEYEVYPSEFHYFEEDRGRAEYRLAREPHSRDHSPSRIHAEADRFLEELVPNSSLLEDTSKSDTGPSAALKAAEADDGIALSGRSQADQGYPATPAHPAGLSTASNHSRYEERRPARRQMPDSGGVPRRPVPYRRRDKQEYVPSRYYRSVAREEPFARGSSMSRSQSKRYERYEEQRRRIDQQETPQPPGDRDQDPPFSRDHSVEQGPPDDPYPPPLSAAPREYVPLQDRLHPYPPSRYRYGGAPEDARGSPVYLDEYGQPLQEYEVIRVPRDYRQARPAPRPPSRYRTGHDPEPFQYVPVSYDRPPPHRYTGLPAEYVYYEERDRLPPARRPAYEPESEASYEPPPPPPEIKVEGAAPGLDP
ncbi:hypothetical protein K491DRAFT_642688 [Lophiostoma macrostomum CBS 122681]|uniref:DUF7892 domain-containing protein n=1 Tax=Lophiostoma macrostomum CBS 122681 TaxID=1314788 RepID=A0A6A6SKV4_9PLEO|nr:hypothetical protein K491DRAFT_642688 [Lophiostoma macrostomum CBS 122681]